MVLNFPQRIGNVLSFAQAVETAMKGNPSFPSPTPPLTTLATDITALASAEAVAVTKTKGAADQRDVKLATVHTDLKSLQNYVQNVADAVGPTDAAALIEIGALGCDPLHHIFGCQHGMVDCKKGRSRQGTAQPTRVGIESLQ